MAGTSRLPLGPWFANADADMVRKVKPTNACPCKMAGSVTKVKLAPTHAILKMIGQSFKSIGYNSWPLLKPLVRKFHFGTAQKSEGEKRLDFHPATCFWRQHADFGCPKSNCVEEAVAHKLAMTCWREAGEEKDKEKDKGGGRRGENWDLWFKSRDSHLEGGKNENVG